MVTVERMLVVNRGAGSSGDELIGRLESELPGYELRDDPFDSSFVERLSPEGATVVVAGGDGTVSAVARALAGTPHTLGILALGTFNNFARSLGLPADIDSALEVVRSGRPQRAKVGRVNGRVFLEAAAIGFFGDAIAIGEAAKELHFGELAERLRAATQLRPFRFRSDGDVRLRGAAMSLVVANPASIGARLPVADASPDAPHFELVVNPGLRLVARRKRTYRVRRLRIITEPAASVYADAAEAGMTPAGIETIPGGLSVILPA